MARWSLAEIMSNFLLCFVVKLLGINNETLMRAHADNAYAVILTLLLYNIPARSKSVTHLLSKEKHQIFH
jgi:hypothetical protein